MHRRISVVVGLCVLGLVLLIQLDNATGAGVSPSGSTPSARAAAPSTNYVYLPLVMKNYVAPAPLWRFGIGKARRPLLDYDANDVIGLRFGWYVDWTATLNAPQPYGIEYVPLVRVKQWKLQGGSTWTTWCVGCPYVTPYTYTVSPAWSQIPTIASARPGMLWLIGNEIERIDWNSGGQDEILPEVYAEAYRDLYSLIKNADPTAQVAIGSLIQATPLRLEYLDRVWNGYSQKYGQAMPVDVWNIHAFVLQEVRNSWGADIPAGIDATQGELYSVLDNKNFSIAAGHIVAMRTWMKNKGQQNKPLIVTEYGVNMPDWVSPGEFTPEQVRDSFMYPSFNYFLNQTDANLGYPADGYRLVQRWNWYSLDDDSGRYENGTYYQYFNGNLFYSGLGANPQGLTPLGNYWKQYVQPLPSGATRPYGPLAQPRQTKDSSVYKNPMALDYQVDSTHCGDGQRVRLLFVDPSPPGTIGNLHTRVTPPRVTRESTICLPSQR